MRYLLSLALAWALGLTLSLAQDASGKLVREHWDAAFLNGQKAGHFRTTVHELNKDGQTVYRVTRELRLTIKRFGDVAQLRASTGNDETPDGKLLGVFMTQALGTNQLLRLSGMVEDGVLHDSIEGPQVPGQRIERRITLPDDLLTYLGEDDLLAKKQAKPGDRFSYRLFEPTVNNVVRIQVEVKGYEDLPLEGGSRRLLRVISKPDRIGDVQLPASTQWYDEAYQLVLVQSELPGLGELTLRRTTREAALAPNGRLQDLGQQSVPLDRSIANVHSRRQVVYRVTFTKDFESGEADERLKELRERGFATDDGRQAILTAEGRSLELQVTARREPPTKASNLIVPQEYLDSNFFINSADEKVRELSRQAVGTIGDPWRKAQAIERWVRQNMQAVAFTEAMATADHVARTLRGDCTEFAMLTAAMCRAQGIPARTAIGLVYYLDGQRPKLGYHMWTEVWVQGEWLGLDATLGLGSVGPGHVKITDHSWRDVRSMIPLLPVMRVMSGKPKFEVVRVE